ncbi:MAG: heme exporter protein CcmB [Sphingomonas sp.]|jgi:heme exporter protein B
MIAMIVRDVRRAWSSGGAIFPIAFFLLVTVLFPFGVGPDRVLLAKVGGGVLWAAALLAALLPVERMIAPDAEAGVLDQFALRGIGMEMVCLAKLIAHWLSFGPPLMLATVIGAGLLGIDGPALASIELGLLVGTPGLAALALATGGLVAGLSGAGAVAGLVMLPLAVPIIIFGAGSVDGGAGALKLLGAVSLLLVAGAPFVAAGAIRVGRG